MPHLEKFLIVKRSQIPGAGKGLFTKVAVTKGQRIVEYKGKVVKWKDIKHQDGYNGYLMFMNRNHVINAEPTRQFKARYANDARGLVRIPGLTNNVEYVSEGKRCYIEAKRPIRAGEEILVYYGKEFWALQRKLKRLTKVI